MIRINLLAAERKARQEEAVAFQTGQKLTVGCSLILVARRRCSSAGATGRSAASRRSSTRRSPTAQQETHAAALGHSAGAAVRAAQGAAAAARRADRAAAQGPDRAGPHARSDQPRAAADAVAHRAEADATPTSRHRRPVHDADRRCPTSSPTSKRRATSSARSRSSSTTTEAMPAAAGRADQVQRQGAVSDSPETRSRGAPRPRPARRAKQ